MSLEKHRHHLRKRYIGAEGNKYFWSWALKGVIDIFLSQSVVQSLLLEGAIVECCHISVFILHRFMMWALLFHVPVRELRLRD